MQISPDARLAQARNRSQTWHPSFIISFNCGFDLSFGFSFSRAILPKQSSRYDGRRHRDGATLVVRDDTLSPISPFEGHWKTHYLPSLASVITSAILPSTINQTSACADQTQTQEGCAAFSSSRRTGPFITCKLSYQSCHLILLSASLSASLSFSHTLSSQRPSALLSHPSSIVNPSAVDRPLVSFSLAKSNFSPQVRQGKKERRKSPLLRLLPFVALLFFSPPARADRRLPCFCLCRNPHSLAMTTPQTIR